MEIKRSILDIIASCEIHDNILLLPPVQLNRTDYLAVNKVLEALGMVEGQDEVPLKRLRTLYSLANIPMRRKTISSFRHLRNWRNIFVISQKLMRQPQSLSPPAVKAILPTQPGNGIRQDFWASNSMMI